MERDVRVAIPAPDPAYVDIVSPEFVIEPGQDKMLCTDMIYDGDDTAFGDMEVYQGKFGHHFVLLSTAAPRPSGTTYDCTDIRTMKDFDPFAFPAGEELPAGYGSFLQKGKALVMQLHYLNTSTTPIRVRDVIRLKKMPIADVSTWTSIYVAAHTDIAVPPHAKGHTETFDCTVPKDVDILVLGGHMHEHGKALTIEAGPNVNSLTKLYGIDAWKPEYRDDPPMNLYMKNPMRLTKGTVVRTSCTWDNDTDRLLDFPSEMCVTFGFAAGTKDPVVCWSGSFSR
jgi:hypothetical protein